MEYRIQHADTEEEREKERNFTGLGLTSRKNLCLHPEVSRLSLQCYIYFLRIRFRRRRKETLWMPDVGTLHLQQPWKRLAQILDLFRHAPFTTYVWDIFAKLPSTN